MAGRPRTMAKKAAEFEEQALCLMANVYLTAPAPYRESRNPGDALGRAWSNVLRAAMLVSVETERLGALLRAKAGITEPGPSVDFFTEQGAEEGDVESAPQAAGHDDDDDGEPCA